MVSARRGDARWHRNHIWGRTREDRVLSNNPQSHSRQDRGTLRPTEIMFGVVCVGTRCCLGTPIMVSARQGGARWHRDHVWGYSALARAKPGTAAAAGYAVLPLRFHRNARQGHTLCLTSPAKATSRTLGLHTSEDSNFDLGILQGSATHRSTCGPAQTKRSTQTR